MTRRRVRRVECPLCHRTADIASISSFLYCHYCTVSGMWWYSNGLIWSSDFKEITSVERTRVVHAERSAGENGQVPSEVVQMERPARSQDQPSPKGA